MWHVPPENEDEDGKPFIVQKADKNGVTKSQPNGMQQQKQQQQQQHIVGKGGDYCLMQVKASQVSQLIMMFVQLAGRLIPQRPLWSIVIDNVVLYECRQLPRKCAATIAFWVRK
ncbi:hypothetical protein ACLKA6_011797 [Drosophila palustris]